MKDERKAVLAAIILATVGLAGCATYEQTLVNSEGKTTTCRASGKSGIVTGYYLKKVFDDCVSSAKAAGYAEAPEK